MEANTPPGFAGRVRRSHARPFASPPRSAARVSVRTSCGDAWLTQRLYGWLAGDRGARRGASSHMILRLDRGEVYAIDDAARSYRVLPLGGGVSRSTRVAALAAFADLAPRVQTGVHSAPELPAGLHT